jgi:EmrB/QacA subfamily drug resistance transporter
MEGKDLRRSDVLICTSLSSFLTPLSLSAVNVALPKMGTELKMNLVELNWVATSYLISSACFLLPFGKIADTYGRKKVFLLGMTLFTFMSLFLSISGSFATMVVLRMVQGVGAAMIFGTALAILSSAFDPKERGRVLGINVASVYLGLSLGPFIGGLITQNLSWRLVFGMNVPIGILVVLYTLAKIKGEWYGKREEGFDFFGSSLYVLSISLIVIGFSKIPKIETLPVLTGGVFALLIFAYRESKTGNPIFQIRMIRKNRVFAYSNLAALIHYGSTHGLSFLMSLFLQNIKGLPPDKTGFILVAQPIVQSLLSPFAGRISDKIEPRIVSSIGMGITTTGILLLSLSTPSTEVVLILVSLIIVGTGFAFFASPNANAIMSSVGPEFYGTASSMVATMRLIGQVLSMGVVMIVFSLDVPGRMIGDNIHHQFMEAFRTILLIYSSACAFGVIISLKRGKIR